MLHNTSKIVAVFENGEKYVVADQWDNTLLYNLTSFSYGNNDDDAYDLLEHF